jgi:hypothetical protein
MFPYQRSRIDEPTREYLLSLMAQDSSRGVIRHDFQEGFWSLLVDCYPLAQSYHWLTQGLPVPNDLATRRDYYFDSRRLLYWFWNSLCEPSLYGAPRPRLADGTNQDLLQHHLKHLTALSFEIAINTWYSTCIEWLQVCNVDWYYKDARRWPGQLKPWKSGEERAIPQYLAGAMALEYF